jgi:hypothetical protein
MPDWTVLDRWWTEWLALFPREPLWNPYGAGLVLVFCLIAAFRLLARARFWVFDRPKRPIDSGLDD